MSAKNVTVAKSGHFLNLSRNGDLDKESVTFDVRAEWRSEAVTMRVTADRYNHSNGMSQWRIYGGNGVYGDDLHGFRLRDLSDTAKARIVALARPMVEDWLSSGEWDQSHVEALYYVIKGMVVRFDHYGPNPTADFRNILDKNAHFIGDDRFWALRQVANTFDDYMKDVRDLP